MPNEEIKISQVEADAIAQKGLEDGKDDSYNPPNSRWVSWIFMSNEELEKESAENKIYDDAYQTGVKLQPK